MEEEEVRKDGDWVRAAMGGGMRDGGVLSQLRLLIAVKRHHGHNISSFSLYVCLCIPCVQCLQRHKKMMESLEPQ